MVGLNEPGESIRQREVVARRIDGWHEGEAMVVVGKRTPRFDWSKE
jgi:hypothetical protein